MEKLFIKDFIRNFIIIFQYRRLFLDFCPSVPWQPSGEYMRQTSGFQSYRSDLLVSLTYYMYSSGRQYTSQKKNFSNSIWIYFSSYIHILKSTSCTKSKKTPKFSVEAICKIDFVTPIYK